MGFKLVERGSHKQKSLGSGASILLLPVFLREEKLWERGE